MKEIEELENGKLMFHSYEALKKYCDDVKNPLDKVVLGKEITALYSDDENGNIRGLFAGSDRTNEQFKGIADWDVSNITDMSCMFYEAKSFNQPLDEWDVSKVENMDGMFYCARTFNQPLNNWDVSRVYNMSYMFAGAEKFNQSLNSWDVSKVKYMSCMFRLAKNFNQPLGNWNVSKVEYMACMFNGAKNFNQPLNNWNVSKVKDMSYMFSVAENFNQPLENWDVSKVENMESMFCYAESFNQPLDEWDVSKVENMEGMFYCARTFNQPLNNWDISNVSNMHSMFWGAKNFNQPLSTWGIEDYVDLGLPKNYEDKFKNRDKLLSTVDTDTKSKIKLGLESVVNDLNNKKTNTTDCDWIFDDCKEMIIDAVNHKVSLSAIVKVIDTASTYTHTNADGTKKLLKVTITKLTKWLKTQGIEREVRRCAKKVIKKEKTS